MPLKKWQDGQAVDMTVEEETEFEAHRAGLRAKDAAALAARPRSRDLLAEIDDLKARVAALTKV